MTSWLRMCGVRSVDRDWELYHHSVDMWEAGRLPKAWKDPQPSVAGLYFQIS